MKWSKQQKDVFKAFRDKQDVLVSADAGSGKTTLLMELSVRNPANSLLLSFNKDIQKANEKKAKGLGILKVSKKVRGKNEWINSGHLEVKTFHTWGLSFYPKKPTIDMLKVDKLCEREFGKGQDAKAMAWILKQLRGRGFLATDKESLVSEFKCPSVLAMSPKSLKQWIANVGVVSELLKRLDKNIRTADFDDMCRQPIKRGWIDKGNVPEILYVDECQDLNPDQRLMVVHAHKAGCHVCAVGDKKQAIYGFRGAYGSLELLQEELKLAEYPLNTSYRCPRRIMKFVNHQVADSQGESSKAGGEVVKKYIMELPEGETFADMVMEYQPDMIISSRNSTLIKLWVDLFLLGQDASLKGSGVIPSIKKMIGSNNDWRGMMKRLRSIAAMDAQAYQLEMNKDIAAGILTLIEGLKLSNKASLLKVVSKMNKPIGLMLETVHSAKGREADHIMVVCDWWQSVKDQLDNVRYVAFTRAIKRLTVVK